MNIGNVRKLIDAFQPCSSQIGKYYPLYQGECFQNPGNSKGATRLDRQKVEFRHPDGRDYEHDITALHQSENSNSRGGWSFRRLQVLPQGMGIPPNRSRPTVSALDLPTAPRLLGDPDGLYVQKVCVGCTGKFVQGSPERTERRLCGGGGLYRDEFRPGFAMARDGHVVARVQFAYYSAESGLCMCPRQELSNPLLPAGVGITLRIFTLQVSAAHALPHEL